MRRGGAGAVGTGLLFALAALSACKKENESLVLLNITADSQAGNILHVTLSAPGSSHVFDVAGLSSTPTALGLYLPEAVTGDITVSAKAIGPAGCEMGYSGRTNLNVAGGGVTVGPFSMVLMRDNVCGTGGTGGSGGGSGGGGASGSGGTTGTAGTSGCTGVAPPAGTPPALTCCKSYDHEADCAANAYVYTVAFSPDGKLVVTGGDDGRVKLWSFDGTKLTSMATLSDSGYGYAAFSPDSKLIAVGRATGEIDVWSTTALSGAPTAKLMSSSGSPYGLAFTPDGQHVVSIDDVSLYVHSLAGGTPATVVTTLTYNYLLSVAPSAVNGNVGIAVTGSDGNTAIYNLGPTYTLSAPVVLNVNVDANAVLSGAFSPNGALLALGDYDAVTRFWTYPVASASTPPTGANIVIDPTLYQVVNGLAFSPNGSYLAIAAGYPSDISIWNVASRTELHRYALPGTSAPNALAIAFSPSGNALVVGAKGCGQVLLCTE